MEDSKLTIPADIRSELDLNPGNKVELIAKGSDLIIRPITAKANLIRNISIMWYLPVSIVSGLFFYWFTVQQNLSQIKLHGDNSLASMLIYGSIVTGLVFFTFFYFKNRRQLMIGHSRLYLRIYIPVLISFAVILVLGLLGTFWVIGQMFKGVSFDPFTSTVIFILFNGVVNYLMIVAAYSVSTTMMTNLLMSVIVGGLAVSMLSNQNNGWWRHNFSFLGTQNAANAWQFNLSLMLSSLVMFALVDYLFVSLHQRYAWTWKLMTIRIILSVTALDVGAIGLFPNEAAFHDIHDRFAQLLVSLTMLLMIGVNWLLPEINREFQYVSLGAGIGLVLSSYGFYGVHYLSLTAFEIIAFMFAFSWILFLLQHIKSLTEPSSVLATVDESTD